MYSVIQSVGKIQSVVVNNFDVSVKPLAGKDISQASCVRGRIRMKREGILPNVVRVERAEKH
jgi:hypothetical protein